jgi:hypothetical protein
MVRVPEAVLPKGDSEFGWYREVALFSPRLISRISGEERVFLLFKNR